MRALAGGRRRHLSAPSASECALEAALTALSTAAQPATLGGLLGPRMILFVAHGLVVRHRFAKGDRVSKPDAGVPKSLCSETLPGGCGGSLRQHDH
jgi:hypothetical protein